MKNNKWLLVVVLILFLSAVLIFINSGNSLLNRAEITANFERIEENGFKCIDFKDLKNLSNASREGAITVTNGEKGSDVRYGYINSKGQLIVEPKYKTMGYFINGYSLLFDEGNNPHIIDKEGKDNFENALAEINEKNYSLIGYTGFGLNNKAVLLMQDKLNDGVYEGSDYAYVKGVLDASGELTFFPGKNFDYQEIADGKFGKFIDNFTQHGELLSLVDMNGQEIPPNEDGSYTIKNYAGNLDWVIGKSGKYGVRDSSTGEMVTPLEYRHPRKIEAGDKTRYFATKNDLLDGSYTLQDMILDENGQPLKNFLDEALIDEKYTLEGPFDNLNFPVNIKYKKTDIVDIDGNLVLNTEWDKIKDIIGKIGVYKLGSKYGFTDSVGKQITPPEYDHCEMVEENVGYAQKGEEFFIVKFDVGN